MTAPSRRSRGARHSYLVKRGIHRLPEPIIQPEEFAKAAASAHRANVWRGMVKLERLRQERASYAEAIQPVSHQEYRTMTNRFSR